jgi:hypothetical protein
MDKEEEKQMTWGKIFAGVIAIIIILSIFAFPIMFLWNGLLPDLTNGQAPLLDYRQAWGLAVLTFCLGRCFNPGR